MNKYNPNIHHRRSIRLKGYDYAQAGLYFITICVKDRVCLFGEIKNGKIILNHAGKMVEKWYRELEYKYPDKKCHEMVVMPNHFHCIIEITEPVGADLRVCPNNECVYPNNSNTPISGDSSYQIQGDSSYQIQGDSSSTISGDSSYQIQGDSSYQIQGDSSYQIQGEHIGSPLHCVVQWFKTMTTNEYIRGVKNNNWKPFDGKLWQRNYWEHIIRNEQSYNRISEYIINNPENWNDDKFYELGKIKNKKAAITVLQPTTSFSRGK